MVEVVINPVGNEDENMPAVALSISSYPNPFRESAEIRYQLEKQSAVELKIYNLRGQVVRTLHQGQQTKGEQVLAWEGCDDRAQPVAAGIYLVRMTVDGEAGRPLKLLKR
jgi:hypothetical protein